MIQTKTRLTWYLEAKSDKKLLNDMMARLDDLKKAFDEFDAWNYSDPDELKYALERIIFDNADDTSKMGRVKQ
jgi:hypothetical protein